MKTYIMLPLIIAAALASSCKCPCSCDSGADASMEAATLGTLQPLQKHGNFWLGGQPTAEDLKAGKAAGLAQVINLRTPGEIDWDEGAAAEELGMTYHNIAFKAPETLTDEVFAKAVSTLGATGNTPTLMHCKSANRVGALWLVHRVLNDGTDLDAALEEAKTVGLRSPDYEARAKDYIARNK